MLLSSYLVNAVETHPGPIPRVFGAELEGAKTRFPPHRDFFFCDQFFSRFRTVFFCNNVGGGGALLGA